MGNRASQPHAALLTICHCRPCSLCLLLQLGHNLQVGHASGPHAAIPGTIDECEWPGTRAEQRSQNAGRAGGWSPASVAAHLRPSLHNNLLAEAAQTTTSLVPEGGS